MFINFSSKQDFISLEAALQLTGDYGIKKKRIISLSKNLKPKVKDKNV